MLTGRLASRAARSLSAAVTAVILLGVIAAVTVIGGGLVLRATGQQIAEVLSGSMTPEFRPGDAVLIRPAPKAADLHVGQIVMFMAPGAEHPTTHRIHALYRLPQGLFIQTKGDANPTPDPNLSPAGSVKGILGTVIPHGSWLVWGYGTKQGRGITLGIPLALLLTTQVIGLVKAAREDEESSVPESAGDDMPGQGRDGPEPDDSDDGEPLFIDLTEQEPAEPGPRSRMVTGLGGTATVIAAVTVSAVALSAFGTAHATGAVYTATSAAASTTYATGQWCDAASTDAYTKAALADQPTIFWPHNGTTGTTMRSLTGTGTGTYGPGVMLGQPGAVSCTTAARFTGTGGGTAGERTQSNRSFSIETFFATSSHSMSELVGQAPNGGGDSAVRGVFLTSQGSVVFAAGQQANSVLTGGSGLADGHWHHVLATYSADRMALYVDGGLVASLTDPAAVTPTLGVWGVAGPNLSGWAGAQPAVGYTGALADTAIYPVALTAAQDRAHWAAAGH